MLVSLCRIYLCFADKVKEKDAYCVPQVYTLSLFKNILMQSWDFMRLFLKKCRTFAAGFLQEHTLY